MTDHAQDLIAKITPTPDELAALRARLAILAARDGILDVSYRIMDSPVGTLLLAATPRGVVRIAFECEDHDQVMDTLSQKLSPRMLHAPARLDEAARELAQYFAGDRTRFDLPLDFSLSAGFRHDVHRHLGTIRYGHTQSYSQVARLLGRPNAVRAVGTACATNPLPVVVPCHRVVRSDGSLGGYAGGLAAKGRLLDLEKLDLEKMDLEKLDPARR
jgi:methylated-DNA-[protein]-cysteine S-methyltransferase